MEMRYEYAPDGKIAKVSAVDSSNSLGSTYGPEKYVVDYKYDDAGRLVRKSVVNNPKDPEAEHYNSDYTYDGMGRLVRERIWCYDRITDMIIVTFYSKHS